MQIDFVGEGEPLLHPDIIEMARYVKSKGMICKVITNGSLFTDEMIEAFKRDRLDELNISVHAATIETFHKIHPKQPKMMFDKIKRDIKKFSDTKLPKVIMTNVIFSHNYHEIEAMLDFAIEVGAERIFFKPMSIPPHVKELRLGEGQKKEMLDIIENIPKSKLEKVQTNLEEMKKFFTGPAIVTKDVPCYTGWVYSKILQNGDVIACCDGYDHMMGKVDEGTSFKDIWQSGKYKEFREAYDDVGKRMKMGFTCDRCQFYSQNVVIDDSLERFGIKKMMELWKK
jgi:radical SAM protein with 4Fe4S-binding SPASM domain